MNKKVKAEIFEARCQFYPDKTENEFEFTLPSFQKLAKEYDCSRFVIDIAPERLDNGLIEITVYNDFLE